MSRSCDNWAICPQGPPVARAPLLANYQRLRDAACAATGAEYFARRARAADAAATLAAYRWQGKCLRPFCAGTQVDVAARGVVPRGYPACYLGRPGVRTAAKQWHKHMSANQNVCSPWEAVDYERRIDFICRRPAAGAQAPAVAAPPKTLRHRAAKPRARLRPRAVLARFRRPVPPPPVSGLGAAERDVGGFALFAGAALIAAGLVMAAKK